MALSNPWRLAIFSTLGIALAISLGLQATSSVTYKRAPELSIALMPANGLAREQYAFAEFSSRVTDPEETRAAAEFASNEAKRALRSEPLAPKAYAILAMAEPDEAKKQEMLTLATRLNRRDLSLHSLWLSEKLAEGNFSETTAALDRILRVYPQYREQFFPILAEALESEETIPQFVQFLKGESPWKERFLAYAVGQRELQPNLAILRARIEIEDEAIDRRLIIGMVRQGFYKEAFGLYTVLSARQPLEIDKEAGSWRSTYPPFDWYLADGTGFRAQPSLNGRSLELSVRPGKGGVLVERFIPAPRKAIQVLITHKIVPVEQLRDVRLQANCAGSDKAYFDSRFSPGEAVFDLPAAPEGCDFISLVINARAWTGLSSIRGTIDSFNIVSVSP